MPGLENPRKAVITGLGPVSAAGIGKSAFIEALAGSRISLRTLDFTRTSAGVGRLGGAISDFNPRRYIDYKPIRHSDRLSQMAITASWLALEDAGLLGLDAERMAAMGVVIGVGFGNTEGVEEYLTGLFRKGPKFASPLLFPNTVMNAPAGYISSYFGIKGPNLTFNHRAISGENAIGYGMDLIHEGKAEVVLAGGIDELGPNLFCFFERLGLLSPVNKDKEGIWPYDAGANGLCLGEGAGILVLEERGHAISRGVHLYAELETYAIAASRSKVEGRRWDGDGLIRAIQQAMNRAEIGPEKIDGVIGSGCGHPEHDKLELKALSRVFNPSQGAPFLYSPKFLTGHFDGIGGLKAIVGALAISEQKVWPNRFLFGPRKRANLELPDKLEKRRIRRLLLVSMAVGGTGLALLLREPVAEVR